MTQAGTRQSDTAYERLRDMVIRDALKPGKNTVAVHCHQTTGGQYIDVGIVEVSEAK